MGVYDAPIKYKGQGADAVPLSQMALLLGEQIKNKYDVLDSVIVSLRINDEFTDDDSQGDEKVKEIHSDDENDLLLTGAFSCQGQTHTRKIKFRCDRDVESEVLKQTKDEDLGYMEIVDFDDHLADISLDWTNP